MGHLILVSEVILVISADFSFWTSFRALNNFWNVLYIIFPGDDLSVMYKVRAWSKAYRK